MILPHVPIKDNEYQPANAVKLNQTVYMIRSVFVGTAKLDGTEAALTITTRAVTVCQPRLGPSGTYTGDKHCGNDTKDRQR
jgi:hypothetical protein